MAVMSWSGSWFGPAPDTKSKGTRVHDDFPVSQMQVRRAEDGKELYQGLASEFLEWGRRFERKIVLAYSSCGFYWSKDLKVALIGHYLDGVDKRYFNKQINVWWNQNAALQLCYVVYSSGV